MSFQVYLFYFYIVSAHKTLHRFIFLAFPGFFIWKLFTSFGVQQNWQQLCKSIIIK